MDTEISSDKFEEAKNIMRETERMKGMRSF